jgi:hypothetical protein
LKGDTANAIKAYEGYFTFNLDFVDPYLDYIALLKATEGIARTRQIVEGLYAANKTSPTPDLVSATLMDAPDDRVARLRALTLREAQYGPGWLELGVEYNRAFVQTPTNDLAQKQQAAFDTAFKLESEQQGYSRYFIDKTRADKNLADARQALAGAQQYGKLIGNVDFQILPYYDGVQILIYLPEAGTAQKLLYSIDDPQPKIETGRTGAGNVSAVNTALGTIKLPIGEHTVYAQYIDANGTASQVYSKKFRVDPIAIVTTQMPPDFSTGLVPVTVTAGLVDAAQDKPFTYKYSVDSKALDQEQEGFFITTINLKLKPGEHTLYIQATGTDGESTPVVEYPLTVK